MLVPEVLPLRNIVKILDFQFQKLKGKGVFYFPLVSREINVKSMCRFFLGNLFRKFLWTFNTVNATLIDSDRS